MSWFLTCWLAIPWMSSLISALSKVVVDLPRDIVLYFIWFLRIKLFDENKTYFTGHWIKNPDLMCVVTFNIGVDPCKTQNSSVDRVVVGGNKAKLLVLYNLIVRVVWNSVLRAQNAKVWQIASHCGICDLFYTFKLCYGMLQELISHFLSGI